jgi:hypothetical protein
LALLDEIDARADALTLKEERLMTRVLAACDHVLLCTPVERGRPQRFGRRCCRLR